MVAAFPTVLRYGWAWIEGEDDDAGNSWIQIGPLDHTEYGTFQSDEMAVIMCRNYERVRSDHPEWIEWKERDAQKIVDALNAHSA
jgi:hypothetical protein